MLAKFLYDGWVRIPDTLQGDKYLTSDHNAVRDMYGRRVLPKAFSGLPNTYKITIGVRYTGHDLTRYSVGDAFPALVFVFVDFFIPEYIVLGYTVWETKTWKNPNVISSHT